jgi:hypothetical protein
MAQAKTWSFTTMAPPPLGENFTSGVLPAGWTVVDNARTGAVWRFDNPKPRTNATGGTGGFAIADSDYVGTVNMDTELRSPSHDLTGFTSVTLGFKTDFFYYSGETADVDVSANGATGPWTNVWRKTASYRGPKAEQIDITALAAGKANVMVRFHYYNANFDWYWEVDDVLIGGTQASPVRLLSPAPVGYPAIQAAYDSAPGGSIIQALAATFTENLDFARDISVALKGGFDTVYTANDGTYSVLTGNLRLRGGTVKVENLRFR